MSQIRHNSGLSEQVSEIGFDTVKAFGGSVTSTAFTLTIDPPARRLTLRNAGTVNDIYLRINDSPATSSISLVPGDDIKIGPLCVFSMDFDTLNEISIVTSSGTSEIEGILGWKGIAGC